MDLEPNHRLLSFTSFFHLSCKVDLCESDAVADVQSSGRNVINFALAERFLSCQATNINSATVELLVLFSVHLRKKHFVGRTPGVLRPPVSQPSVLFFRLVVDEVCKVALLSPSSGMDSNYSTSSRLFWHTFC